MKRKFILWPANSSPAVTSLNLPGGGVITGASGNIQLTAGGTNQNITLTPSGTGVIWARNSTASGRPTLPGDLAFFNTTVGATGGIEFQYATTGSGFGIRLVSEAASDGLRVQRRNNSAAWTSSSLFRATDGAFITDLVLLGTPTDSSNGRLQIATHTTAAGGIGFGTDVNLFRIGNNALALDSTSTNTLLRLCNNGTIVGTIGSNGANVEIASSSGELLFNVGATTALTLSNSANAFFAGSATAIGAVSAGADYQMKWTGRSTLKSPSDGVVSLLNNAETDFSRLQFGGTTSSFPALKRSTQHLLVRLADDSAYTDLYANNLFATGGRAHFSASGSLLIRAGAGAPEGVVAADAGSLYLRTDGGAGTSLYVKESGTGNTGWVAK